MPIKYLLTSQANQLLEGLESEEWNPADFRWDETPSTNYSNEQASRILHLSSGYYFIFDNVGNAFSPSGLRVRKQQSLKSSQEGGINSLRTSRNGFPI